MSKRNKRRSHVEKWEKVKPDESFTFGPLRVSRHGKYVHLENRATPEEHVAMLARMKDAHKATITDLETSIASLQAEIQVYDPIELMHRAAYMLIPLLLKYYSENQYETSESLALPAAEYLQYLISRTPTAPEAERDIDESAWDAIWQHLIKVLQLTQDYLFSRPTITTPPTEIDELRFFTDARRLGIRIRRYTIYFADHLRDALLPLEAAVRDAYGISVEDLIKGLCAIHSYQSTGIFDRYQALRESHKKFVQRLEEEVPSLNIPEDVDLREFFRTSPAFEHIMKEASENARLAFTPAAFDITDLSNLPAEVLSALSIKPGQSPLDKLTGPNHDDLSPLSTSIFHDRPFIEKDGRVYSFYHSGLEDRTTELLEHDIFARFPDREGSLRRKRDEYLEVIAVDLLTVLLKPDADHRNAYYPNPDQAGHLTELDALVAVDDILFLVEVKAGGLSEAARRGAPQSLYSELNDTIGTGQRQSERAEKYIRSADEVSFFDSTGRKEICRIRSADFRRIFRVIITREDLGWVGARIASLSLIEPTLSTSLPWHVSLDDLRAIGELFHDSSVRFAHFLEQRLEASEEHILGQHDEIEHVGLYNKINFYHELPVRGVDRMSFDASWMRDIDEYFAKKYRGEEVALPRQRMPARLSDLMTALNDSDLRGRFSAASIIFDMDDESRDQLEQGLAHLDAGVDEARPRSMRMPFSAASHGLSVTYFADKLWDQELIRSAAMMENSGCSRWVIVKLESHSPYVISQIETLIPGRFSATELAPAFEYIETMAQQKIASEKPGRNDRCPCGSGKKYKKCHGA